MIDLDILVSAKRTELTQIFPGYTYEQLRDLRGNELRKRAQKRFREAEKDPVSSPGNEWMDQARRGSQRLLEAIQSRGLAA
jgi:hypothetical protein